jgi:simple sugar transport system substrate-binding protein
MNIDLRFADAQQKQENQIKALRSFIAQKVDVIAFSPVVETGWDTVLMEAKAAKIPVILTDRSITADSSLYVGFIGSDFVEEGRKAGRWVSEKFKDATEDVNIVEIQGTVGSGPALDRKKGFEEIIAANPHLKIIRSQSGEFTRAKGKEVMEAFLKAETRKIHVLYAHNDDMAIGAIQAIEEAGMKPGRDIQIVSVDAVKGAFEAMIAGKLNATIECNPLLGPQLMTSVVEVYAGKPIPKRIVVEEQVFTMETAKQYIQTRKY